MSVDHVEHFGREAAAFRTAARAAAALPVAPAVPSCPGWTATDLVLHLGTVHRAVGRILAARLREPPPMDGDLSWLGLREEWASWLPPGHAPERSPLPAGLVDWFGEGAAGLHELFRATGPDVPVWTWWTDHSAGFWQRMQAIEAAVHRWDAENATGTARPVDADLAADAVGQTFEIMAPARRARAQAPPGQGERYLFRRTDGPGTWAVRFDGDAVQVGTEDAGHDIEISGTASALMLFLWQREEAGELGVTGDASLIDRYFALVPPG